MSDKTLVKSPVEGVILGGVILPPNYVESKEYRAQGEGFTSWAGRPYRLDQYGNPYFKCKTCLYWIPASSRFFSKVGNHCITRFNLRQGCKECHRASKLRASQIAVKDPNVFVVVKYKKTSDSYEYRGCSNTKAGAMKLARELSNKEDQVYKLNKKFNLFKVIRDRIIIGT